MGYDPVWGKVHKERNWGKYPKEELVRWTKRTFPNCFGTVLDLGCGHGASSWFLAREGFVVVALDGSIDALRKTQEHVPEALTVQACMTELPFDADYFDAVVDVVSSAHNTHSEVEKIFKEIHRVLKPSGKLFSVLPTNNCSRRPFVGLGHVSYFEYCDVELLLDGDFDSVSILRSSYQLEPDCTVDNWIISATNK